MLHGKSNRRLWDESGQDRILISRSEAVSTMPVKSSPAGIEPVGLQLGESVVAAGTAAEDYELAADELATTTGEACL